ncbi:hypothetical protein NZK32_09355 [Cyanobium sp. FGCU-52]|nr:hypothetical protein [Cyanobium sp. FGCU52]
MDASDPSDLIAAAGLYRETAWRLLSDQGRLHVETLIASTARMAGSLLYRSFGFDPALTPGTAVFSDQANQQGPQLMQVMLATLQRLGHAVDESSLDPAFCSTAASQLDFLAAHGRLAPFFLKIAELKGLDLPRAAEAAAIATGLLVHDGREVLPVERGAAIAVAGLVEGCKTAPPPVPPV